MKKFLFILLSLFIGQGFGQSAPRTLISTGGSTFNQAGFQLDWSLGELTTQTYSNGGYILSQGFQQGNLIVTGIDDFDIHVEISVYPNPTSRDIKIDWQSYNQEESSDFQVVITDLSGKVVCQKKLKTKQLSIDVSTFKTGVYLLTILRDNLTIKSFKIIKNK